MKSETFALISQAFLDQLRAKFPGPTVTPGMQHDEIMYKAGQAQVIQWIETQVKSDSRAINRAI